MKLWKLMAENCDALMVIYVCGSWMRLFFSLLLHSTPIHLALSKNEWKTTEKKICSIPILFFVNSKLTHGLLRPNPLCNFHFGITSCDSHGYELQLSVSVDVFLHLCIPVLRFSVMCVCVCMLERARPGCLCAINFHSLLPSHSLSLSIDSFTARVSR